MLTDKRIKVLRERFLNRVDISKEYNIDGWTTELVIKFVKHVVEQETEVFCE